MLKLALFIGSFVYLTGCSGKIVSDDELARRWRSRSGDFEELIKLFGDNPHLVSEFYLEQTKRQRLSSKRQDNSSRAEASRITEPYDEEKVAKKVRSLMRQLGLKEFSGGRDEIYLVVESRGILLNGMQKGYAYLAGPPFNQVKEPLPDNVRRLPRGAGRLYRHLSGNWYLFLDYDD